LLCLLQASLHLSEVTKRRRRNVAVAQGVTFDCVKACDHQGRCCTHECADCLKAGRKKGTVVREQGPQERLLVCLVDNVPGTSGFTHVGCSVAIVAHVQRDSPALTITRSGWNSLAMGTTTCLQARPVEPLHLLNVPQKVRASFTRHHHYHSSTGMLTAANPAVSGRKADRVGSLSSLDQPAKPSHKARKVLRST